MPEHFHFSLKYVHPKQGRSVALDKSTYARRVRERDLRSRESVRSAADYMRRTAELNATRLTEVAAVILLTNGWDVSSDELWTAVDHANKGKNGQYKQHAGKNPRIAQFGEASFPRGVSEEAAIQSMRRFANAVADKYGCAIEAVAHRKEGVIDHAHFLISDRQVGPNGPAPTKICEFNGVSNKLSDAAVRDGDSVLSASMEWMRSFWASEMRYISGRGIRHESFKRQGLGITPLTYFQQCRMEAEKFHGTSACRHQRTMELAARSPTRSAEHIQLAAKTSVPHAKLIDIQQPLPKPAICKFTLKQRSRRRNNFTLRATALALGAPARMIASPGLTIAPARTMAAVAAATVKGRKKVSRNIGEILNEEMAEMHRRVHEELKANVAAAKLEEEVQRAKQRQAVILVRPTAFKRPKTSRPDFFTKAALAALAATNLDCTRLVRPAILSSKSLLYADLLVSIFDDMSKTQGTFVPEDDYTASKSAQSIRSKVNLKHSPAKNQTNGISYVLPKVSIGRPMRRKPIRCQYGLLT